MSTSRSYHHGDLRGALLAAGMDMLRGEGVSALSLRELARRVGVSQTAPYRHFASKDELLAALAEDGFRVFADDLRMADRSAVAGGELVAQAGAYVAFATREPALFRLMFGPLNIKSYPGLAAASFEAFGVLSHRVTHLTPAADVEARTIGSWALVHGLAMLVIDGRLEGAADPAELVRLVASYLDGNRTPTAGP
jgi:AcrR family transcriptional regulator